MFHRVRLPIENAGKLLCITESKGKIEFSSELPVGELSLSLTHQRRNKIHAYEVCNEPPLKCRIGKCGKFVTTFRFPFPKDSSGDLAY